MEEEVLNIVVVGHVDHGKSTLIGRLLYDTHSLPEGTVEKVKRIAQETGKPFEYAYLLDAFEEEQKQGITIDTTQIQFRTVKRDYVIIDAPGHKEFLKHMISGAANAKAAVLVIDAQEGVQEQSKRHAYLLSLLGIEKVYVVLNKMDLVDYAETVFEQVKQQMASFLHSLDIYPLDYIPVSAYYGENILSVSSAMPWYSGQSLLNALDRLEQGQKAVEKRLRLPIQDVYKFDERRILAGRLESGSLAVGEEIMIYPAGKKTVVKSVEYWRPREEKERVTAGESVGITVVDEFFNRRGEWIVHEERLPLVSNSFRASVFWMGRNDFVPEKKYKIKLTTQEVEGSLKEILSVIDTSCLSSSAGAKKITLNDVAEVIMVTKEPLVFDLFIESDVTGRFVIVDGYDVAGGGIITGCEQQQESEWAATFYHQELKARGDIFEEFYYDVIKMDVEKERAVRTAYTVGDVLPLQGKSYHYPSCFDVAVMRDQVMVLIRDGRVFDLVRLEDYVYQNYPLTNGRGFALYVDSAESFAAFVAAYQERKEEIEFFQQWISLTTYRKLSHRSI